MTTSFIELTTGADAGDAFLASSYADMASYPPTGLGQKHGFIRIEPEIGEKPHEAASRLIENDASPIFGVDAPAGCIQVDGGQFLFFGWARKDDRAVDGGISPQRLEAA